MPSELNEKSLRYHKTRLLCPSGHGLKRVISVSDNRSVLSFGCSRTQSLPTTNISVEQLAALSAGANRLFPATPPMRTWTLDLAA